MRGEYQHTVDAKGRMIFPSRLREELGDEFVIFKGLDNCIYAYSMKDWEVFESKLSALPSNARKIQRFFSDNTVCVPDAQGRILIPQSLREYAGIKKNVTVAGVINRVEIWDTQAWKDYNGNTSSNEISDLMFTSGV